MRKTALFLALLFAAPMAQADNQYWAIAPGYSKVESGPGDDLEFFTLSALYGYELHPHLGIEGRVGTTLVREELDADHKYSVDFFGSAFVRINVLSEDVRPYVLLGGPTPRPWRADRWSAAATRKAISPGGSASACTCASTASTWSTFATWTRAISSSTASTSATPAASDAAGGAPAELFAGHAKHQPAASNSRTAAMAARSMGWPSMRLRGASRKPLRGNTARSTVKSPASSLNTGTLT